MRNHCILIVSIAIAFSTLLPLRLSRAEPTTADSAHAEQKTKAARKLLEKRNFDEALRLFKEAYALNPKVDYLYDIAVTLNALGQHKKALEYFDLLIEEAQKTATPEVVVEALKQQKELRRKLGMIEIVSNQDRALVSIDGIAQGETPLRSLAWDKGPHTIMVTKEGFQSFTKTVQLYDGQIERVQVLLAPLAGPANVVAVDHSATDTMASAAPSGDAVAQVSSEPAADTVERATSTIDLNASVGLSSWSGVNRDPGPSAAFGLRGAYKLFDANNLEAHGGLRLAFGTISETIDGTASSNNFWSALVSPSVRYHLLPNKVSVRFEGNVGITALSGVAPGSILLTSEATQVDGMAAMFELRPLLAFEYQVVKNWFVTAHIAYAMSFAPNLYSSSTISRVDLGIGVAHQL